MPEIGDHASRHLMLILLYIVLDGRTEREFLARRDDPEMSRDRLENVFIDDWAIAKRAQVVSNVEDRRQCGTLSERRNSGVDNADAQLDRFESVQRPESG